MKLTDKDIEEITERVQDLLQLPGELPEFKTEYTDKRGIRKAFQKLYNRKKNYIAFYSPHMRTIYINKRWLTERVMAHEICHVVLDYEFKGKMPGRMQERECQRIENFF